MTVGGEREEQEASRTFLRAIRAQVGASAQCNGKIQESPGGLATLVSLVQRLPTFFLLHSTLLPDF